MPPNPYLLADRRQRAARRRVEGALGVLGGTLPLAGAALAVWLAEDLYAALLGRSPAAYIVGFTGIVSRIGVVLAATLSLSTYSAVVRGPDRGVIDLHPLLPRPWLSARVLGIVQDRVGWLAIAAVFLLPLAGRPLALLLGAAVVLGAWCAGIGAGIGVNLAAPALAMRPALAGLFDAIRGPNPRLQAALLYAPGVALALAGTVTIFAAWGAGRALEGDMAGALALGAPLLVAGLGAGLAMRFAPAMSGIGAVLGEIDAAWATTEAAEDARVVYLEWLVRLVPAPLRLGLQKELRHLWRGHRGWVSASWGLAALAAIAGWTDLPEGPDRLAQTAGGALAVLGFAGVRLGASDPPWLDTLLPIPGRLVARTIAIAACMQVVVAMGATALAIRQGGAAFAPLVRLEFVAILLAGLSAWTGHRLRARGGAVYLPGALLLWALGGVA